MDVDAFFNENQYKRHFQKQLLALLIRKYEASKSFRTGEPNRQRPRVVIKNSSFGDDYEDEMDFRKREWMHDVIIQLSEKGIVRYQWVRYQEGRIMANVTLELGQLSVAYELAELMPREQKMEKLRSVLMRIAYHPWTWVAEWATISVQDLSERKSSGLDLDDLYGYELLVEVLLALPQQDDEIPKRVLSQRLFQDTKVFERHVARRLVHLIQSYSGSEFESDTDALASVGIADHPSSVLISGHVLCSLGNKDTVSLGVFYGGVGLSLDTIQNLEVIDLVSDRVVLIENLTSWHQWVTGRSKANELVIYTGGYPNRSVQQLLKKIGDYIRRKNRTLSIYHWGDMDVGGIRIYEFIRSNYFPELLALWMDERSFTHYVGVGMEIAPSYERKIRDMLMDNRFARWHGLLGLMLSYGKRIEQESMVIPSKELQNLN